MTIDRMHLAFNMLKEFLEKMWADLGENVARGVNDSDPNEGGLLVREEFKQALECVKWTCEEKEKGVAKLKSLTDKLGAWKSNEFKRYHITFMSTVAFLVSVFTFMITYTFLSFVKREE
jgi:hypothetical protein